jgi:ribosomal protein S18 acetylase RimI-like enzyme
MPRIEALTEFIPDHFSSLMTGYTSDARYQVTKVESEGRVEFTLELVSLPIPYRKQPDSIDDEVLKHYREVPALGFSFGAFDGERCVGIALAEPRTWNRSLWVLELHIAESHRRRGIGRSLVDTLVKKSREAGLRTLICETQTTNVPALRFYQSLDFQLEGIDLSYYTNDDYPTGEIAVFMKKRVK